MIDVKKSNNKRAFSIKETAEYACVSRGTVENWLAKGLLPYEEMPGRGNGTYHFRRIRKDDIDEFLNQFYHEKRSIHKNKAAKKIILLPRNT